MADGDTSFITRCPECGTGFRVTAAQLDMADGMVRCGACLQVFRAANDVPREDEAALPVSDEALPDEDLHLLEEDLRLLDEDPHLLDLETADVETADVETADVETADVDHAAVETAAGEADADTLEAPAGFGETDGADVSSPAGKETETSELDAFEQAFDSAMDDALQAPVVEDVPVGDIESPGPTPHEIEALYWAHFELYVTGAEANEETLARAGVEPAVDERPLPDGFDDAGALRGRRDGPLWYVAAAILAGALFLQVAWQQRDDWAMNEAYRPWYERTCGVLGCRVPDYVNLGALEPVNLVIRSHPDIPGALLVDAVLRNRDARRQPFPAIRLSFTDLDSKIVAARRFVAAEYLAGDMRDMRYIPGRTEVRFAISIHDPGDSAHGYVLEVVP